jgi:hypothetical protein
MPSRPARTTAGRTSDPPSRSVRPGPQVRSPPAPRPADRRAPCEGQQHAGTGARRHGARGLPSRGGAVSCARFDPEEVAAVHRLGIPGPTGTPVDVRLYVPAGFASPSTCSTDTFACTRTGPGARSRPSTTGSRPRRSPRRISSTLSAAAGATSSTRRTARRPAPGRGRPDVYHALQATLIPGLPIRPSVAGALR